MSRRAASKDGRVSKPGYGGFSFIRHSISADEKKQFEAWEFTPKELVDFICRYAGTYKIAVAWDDYNHTFSASMSCVEKNHEDFQWILTARAPEPDTALALLAFKHTVLLAESWLAFHEREQVDRSFG